MMISPVEFVMEDGMAARRGSLSEAKRVLLDRRLQGGMKLAPSGSDFSRRAPRSNRAPLSFAQERLWFFTQLDSGSALYNMPIALRLTGRLDLTALRCALDAMVARHEALRTRFISEEGAPVQVINPPAAVELSVVDLIDESGPPQESSLQRILIEESGKPFDLSSNLMLRGTLVRIARDGHVLLLVMHHIVSDAWSWGVFFRELVLLYDGFSTARPVILPELPVQYADFSAWQRDWLKGAVVNRQLAFWKRKLAGVPQLLDLLTDHPRPVIQNFRGRCEGRSLSKDLGDSLKLLSRREGTTLFMTLLAAFKVLLHRYTYQTDLVVGTPVAGRTRIQSEGLIGFFVNTLAIRSNISGDPVFRDFLKRVREETIEAFSHQDLPFERVIEELRPERSASYSPLVQVMFVLQNAPVHGVRMAGLEVSPVAVSTGTAKLDLTLCVEDKLSGLDLSLEYNTDLFDPATAARMLEHFEVLLGGITANANRSVSLLPIITDAERRQLLVEWNRTETNYPRDASIPFLFAEQAARSPDAVAVVFGDEELTYGELNYRANQLAHHLQNLGVGPEVLVGICLERSTEMIIGLLGILKAGGAYVSLDPTCPQERLMMMIEDTQPAILLTLENQHERLAFATTKTRLLRLDTDWPVVAGQSTSDPSCRVRAENLAYVSFTSGSTGRPKGVCIPHRGVVRLVRETNFARLDANEVFLQLAPIAFDASTLEIWGPLLNGGRLVVFPPHIPSLTELGRFIQQHRITTLWLTAGLFQQMIEETPESFRGVRQLLAGGDVLSVPHVKAALRKLGGCKLINGYGPTENTTFTCCHLVQATCTEDRSIPVGRPIANTRVYVLDQHAQPVPIGVSGELFAGGDGIARGYWNRPELTAECFVPDPFGSSPGDRLYKTGDRVRWLADGTIEFLGRIDQQVKVRGFRVETGEIEVVLGGHPAVRECVVVAQSDATGGRQLVAYVVTEKPIPISELDLRDYLGRKLPDHMIPAAFIRLASLPLTVNGKVDRRALPVPERQSLETAKKFIAPRDEVETQLVKIWESVLGVGPVGIQDRFFDLGGHSLLAVRLAARMEKSFGRAISVAAIFQSPTIVQLARIIREEQDAGSGSSLVEIQPKGSKPPLFFVHGVGGGMFWGYTNLSKHLGPDQPVYAFKSRGMDGREELGSIEEIAAHYVTELRGFQPSGPYRLGGYCFGGNVAFEMARLLSGQGAKVEFLVLLNCTPPNSSYMKFVLTPFWIFRFLRNLLYLGGCFSSWSPRQRRTFLRWKIGVVLKKLLHFARPTATGGSVPEVQDLIDLSDQPPEQRRLWEIHVRALMEHHPKPYPGHVTLFRSRGHQFLCSFDPLYGWGDLATGGVSVHLVPGAHESILDEPHVESVASSLRSHLESIAVNQIKEKHL